MDFQSLFADYSIWILLVLSFTAGFLDAVVGGGGLIQLPALLIHLPQTPLPVLFGTNKIAALSGTAVAAARYARRVRFDFRLLAVVSLSAFLAANLGARSLSYLDAATLKPFILLILIVMAVYTYVRKDLGKLPGKIITFPKQLLSGALLGFAVGFYDGFFGPGTGSFFVLGFVVLLGFEFVTASAYAKMVNCVTNFSALLVFVRQGNYLAELAILMAVCNVAGSVVGSQMALKRGNGFVRTIFLLIVTTMIARYAYDVWLAYA